MTRKFNTLLVTGDRNWTDGAAIEKALRTVSLMGYDTLVHGAARGADTLAAEAAADLGWAILAYRAEWDKYGRSAGIRRNVTMLSADPGFVLAFHDDLEHSRGTGHMVRISREAGLVVRHFSHSLGWQKIA